MGYDAAMPTSRITPGLTGTASLVEFLVAQKPGAKVA